MTSDPIWREFERNEISHSAAHYLMTLSIFLESGFEPKSADLARQMGISRAAVSAQLKMLISHGFVELNEERRLLLTRKGQSMVRRLNGKRLRIETFLRDFLGVSKRAAAMDSCKIEHLISEETADALGRLQSLLDSTDEFTLSEQRTLTKFREKLHESRK
jgi:Mn-dependent DtxR family transcriptional regulator